MTDLYGIYSNERLNREDDLFFLRKYCSYECAESDNEIKFDYNIEPVPDLYGLIPSNMLHDSKTHLDLVIKMMIWVHKTLKPGLRESPCRPLNSVNIIRCTIEKNQKSNCWMYATTLNEILLHLGFKSKMIICMPLDLRISDCHCVVHVYLDELKKWIILDPSFGTYYTNKLNTPINLSEFREILIRGEIVKMPFVLRKYRDTLIGYWTKNLFRFETYSNSCFNIESLEKDKIIYSLLPSDYMLTNKVISHGNCNSIIIHTHNLNDFWK